VYNNNNIYNIIYIIIMLKKKIILNKLQQQKYKLEYFTSDLNTNLDINIIVSIYNENLNWINNEPNTLFHFMLVLLFLKSFR
jgi:hypothetical protein